MLGDLSPLQPFLTRYTSEDIPATAREVMELCAFDWAICGLACRDDAPLLRADVASCGNNQAREGRLFFIRQIYVITVGPTGSRRGLPHLPTGQSPTGLIWMTPISAISAM